MPPFGRSLLLAKFLLYLLLAAIARQPGAEAKSACVADPNRFYVATDGSDADDGSACHPWATLQHAANTVNAGNTVVVEDGTYNQSLYISRGGTATSPITFVSEHKHGAVIAPNGSYTSDSAIISFSGTSVGYVTIKNFDIMDAAGSSSLKWGIRALGNHVSILGNKVHHIDAGPNAPCSSGAAIGPQDYGLVDGNIIYDIGPPRPGKHCYYIHGIYTQGSNTMVTNNIVYDVYQGTAMNANNPGLTNDSFVNNLFFHNGANNVGGDGIPSGGELSIICQGTDGSPTTGGCSGLFIANNILMGDQPGGAYCLQNNGGWTNVVITNNLVHNCGSDLNNQRSWPYTWQNTINADPLLVNYQPNGGGDYHLTSTSPAINKGTSVRAPSVDFDGTSRDPRNIDIGPYAARGAQDSRPRANTGGQDYRLKSR